MSEFMDVLKSKRFWTLVIALLALFSGEIGVQMTEEFQMNIVYLAVAVIGGYSLEDVVTAFMQKAAGLVDDVLVEVVEEIKPKPE